MIEVSVVRLPPEAETFVLEVLRSGRLAQGPVVERFEQAIAGAVDAEHAVAVNSGTAALQAALLGLGIGEGDEVVTSAFTFVATLNAILAVGATPRIVDIGADDFNVDPAAVEAAIGSRTAAVLPVHLFGLPADTERIRSIAAGHGLPVVEDAAQALGAAVDGVPVGSRGPACFSFYATKALTTGEGGMVTTDDARLADGMRVLRNQGMRVRYEHVQIGQNLRMSEMHAAVGLSQVPLAAERLDRRRAHAALLSDGLGETVEKGIRLPVEPAARTHSFSSYTIRVTDDAPVDRDTLRAGLAERGIESAVYYPRAVYDYECYRDEPRVKAEPAVEAERAAREVLSLPVHPWLDRAAIDRIVEGVLEVLAA